MSDITYTCRPATDEETTTTISHLKAHTEACIGVKVEHTPFAITAYEGTTLIGSIIGKIYSGWMHLELVWVDEHHRGKGIGRQLIKLSLTEAKEQNLIGIEVWTQSWQAPEFYIHVGFTEFAVLDDFLPNHKRHVFRYLLKDNLK